MKQNKFSLLSLITLCCAVLLLAPPPAKAMSLFLHRETVTNIVPVVVFSPYTNAQGQVIDLGTTNLEPRVSTTYTPSAGLTNALGIGQQLAPLAPPPWGEMLSGALALALAGATTWGKLATAKANKALDGQQLAQSALNATIAGVEAVGDANTKAMIQSHAVAAGIADHLDTQVQAVADSMPKFSKGPAVPLAQAVAASPGTVTKA